MVVGCFDSVCTLGLYTIKFYLLENIKQFWDISFLDASAYKQFNDHIERAYQGSFREQATSVQERVL